MKKRTRKMLTLLMSAMLLVCLTVGATYAYLTSSDTVENTFTVGNVKITLDEASVNTAGQKLNSQGKVFQEGDTLAARVDKNEYKLMPGHEYSKDPTVHVDANSEDAWLFVKVVDEIAAIEDATTVANQLSTNGWTAVEGDANVYAYKEIVNAGDDVVVFENFKIECDVSNETLASYANAKITVTAYAIQADGFDSAAAAWTAAGSSFSNTGNNTTENT